MNLNRIEHALEILFKYNEEIRFNLIKLGDEIEYFCNSRKKHNMEKALALSRNLKNKVGALLNCLQIEENIEKLIKKLDKKLHHILKEDLKELEQILRDILSILENIESTLPSISSFEDLKQLKKNSEKIKQYITYSEIILKRDSYLEYLMKEVLEYTRKKWEDNIKDESVWLYHGTSILFLPYIQKYGLDSSKLPPKVRRGIERLSKIFEKYGYLKEVRGGSLDVDPEMAKKGISFAFGINVRKHAWASDLPAFMYELLNEEHLRQHSEANKIIENLAPEEIKIFNSIMSFGEELRSKNKVILLQVNLNSEFVKYLGLPDFISDFDEFFFKYFVKRMDFNGLMHNLGPRKESVSYLCRSIQDVFIDVLTRYKIGTGDLTGIKIIKKAVAPPFIYLEVSTPTGYSLINISQWNWTLKPRII